MTETILLQLGEHDIHDDEQTIVRICKKEKHPKYDQITVEYDFAILTLCESVTFSKVSIYL